MKLCNTQVIIFSKNRAAQLDMLLESMSRNVDVVGSTKVIYKATNSDYQLAYNSLFKEWNIAAVSEDISEFKETLLKSIGNYKYIMFLCDDDYFCENLKGSDLDVMKDKDVAALSLRMHPGVNYCYAYRGSQNVPAIKANKWVWKTAQGDWGYPMSLDGNIYRTKDIEPLLNSIQYGNPNQLEGALAGVGTNKIFMAMTGRQVVVGIPWNRVQEENENRNENENVEFFNKLYLKGYKLRISGKVPTNAVHVIPKKKWVYNG